MFKSFRIKSVLLSTLILIIATVFEIYLGINFQEDWPKGIVVLGAVLLVSGKSGKINLNWLELTLSVILVIIVIYGFIFLIGTLKLKGYL